MNPTLNKNNVKMFGQNISIKGFTLVELIVVISILAILGTIAFLSFSGNISKSRDSVRVTDLKSIHKGLAMYNVQAGKYPLPDDYIIIDSVSKQGYAGDSVSRIIKINGKVSDPLNNTRYIYSTNMSQSKMQLLGYLEDGNTPVFSLNNNSLLPQVYSDTNGNIDYTDRFTYTIGDLVGILLDKETNAPINETNTGTLNIVTSTTSYTAIFSNSSSNSGTISGSGQTLLTEISIIQNSCVLGNTVVKSGGSIDAYNTSTVAYNDVCVSKIRNCTNGSWDGDTTYKFDTCSPATPLNCSTTTYNGYSVPAINHLTSQNITKNITGGIADITASCTNGVLTYGDENINCSTNYVLQGGLCVEDKCTGSAPDFSLVNGTQQYGISWLHDINPGVCKYICQAGYYYNSTACTAASIGYMVSDSGQTSQTACSSSNNYQDLTGQTECKTVSAGYYSTPIGANPHTNQVQCEANNYCTNGIKTTCPTGYSSPAGSTSSSDCTINSYTVTGSFGANGAGATVSGCGKSATADASGNFTFSSVNYGTNCNNITAVRSGYTCTVSTNGPSLLSGDFTTVAGSCALNQSTFTANGTFVVPAGVTTVYVTVVGGGGGGGSGGGPGYYAGGGGGGAGYYVKNQAVTVTSGQSIAVTIGAGGVGGTYSTANGGLGTIGSNGGSTIFGSYITKLGGKGGGGGGTGNMSVVRIVSGVGYNCSGGGLGGTGSVNGGLGGNTTPWRWVGMPGYDGVDLSPYLGGTGGAAGPYGNYATGSGGGGGGAGILSKGANGGAGAYVNGVAGSNGTYGSGGGGGGAGGSGTGGKGGNGGAGYLKVTW